MAGGDEVAQALRVKAEELLAALLAKVEGNLSGAVLHERSGRLKAAVVAGIATNGDALAASVGVDDVPYAAVQEHGGRTGAHDIVPAKAQALAFAAGAGTTFARRVHHPGSLIPARAPFGRALDAVRDEIAGGLKAAVLEALGA